MSELIPEIRVISVCMVGILSVLTGILLCMIWKGSGT